MKVRIDMAKKITFEDSISELEDIVSKLESGAMTLEESMEAFQKGVGLVGKCQKILNDYEKKITCLKKEGDTITEAPFFTEETDD